MVVISLCYLRRSNLKRKSFHAVLCALGSAEVRDIILVLPKRTVPSVFQQEVNKNNNKGPIGFPLNEQNAVTYTLRYSDY